nr:MAG TPA: hypothetical protein [Caudoviricetes sp.]
MECGDRWASATLRGGASLILYVADHPTHKRNVT